MPDTGQPAEINHANATYVYATDDSLMPPFEIKKAELEGEFVGEPKPPRKPAVRIVHHGGPAERARVYINGQEATTAHRVELVLDANDQTAPRAWVEFIDPHLDVTADQADAPLIVARKRVFWPILLGLLLDAIPAGLAWWSWPRSGWLAAIVFPLAFASGLIWTLSVIGACFGYGRIMAITEPNNGEDER